MATDDDDSSDQFDALDPSAVRVALRGLLTHRDEAVRRAAHQAVRDAEPPWSDSHVQALVVRATLWAGGEVHEAPPHLRENLLVDRLDRLEGWFETVASHPRCDGRVSTKTLQPATLRTALLMSARGRGKPGADEPAGSRDTALVVLLRELGIASGAEDAIKKLIQRHVKDAEAADGELFHPADLEALRQFMRE